MSVCLQVSSGPPPLSRKWFRPTGQTLCAMGPHPDLHKYVGPCLIATPRPSDKHKANKHYGSKYSFPPASYSPGPWTGAPLFSVSSRYRHPAKSRPAEYSDTIDEILSLSQLALQTEGAPLILNTKKEINSEDEVTSSRIFSPSLVGRDESGEESCTPTTSDSISITSDDSIGNVPRVIKPRKRRKKEKKYGTIVTLKPYQPLFYQELENMFVSPMHHMYYSSDSPSDSSSLSSESDKGARPKSNSPWPIKQKKVKSKNKVPFNGPQRKWVTFGRTSGNRDKFTVMSYNILCQHYATHERYPHLKEQHRLQAYRRTRILAAIKYYSPDILCLQEIETKQFVDHYQPGLAEYTGEFLYKSRHYTANESWKGEVDGCAIFWKKNRFHLKKVVQIEFQKLANRTYLGSESMRNRVAPRDNVALAVVLAAAHDEEKELVVSTTHLHWDPAMPDVKLIQAMLLVYTLQNVSRSAPTIVCGDFNSLRDSGTIQYLNSGAIPHNHPDLMNFDYGNDLNHFANFDGHYYHHGYQFENAYPHTFLDFTNYTQDFKEVIDYIFYSAEQLRRTSILEGLNTANIPDVDSFPTSENPSDHIPIMAEFAFR